MKTLINNPNRVDRQKQSSIYSPRPIGDKNFVFNNSTLATMADSEIAFAHLDEQSTHFPYSSSLRHILANLEALATICVDGVAPDLEAMMTIEAIDYTKSFGLKMDVSSVRNISDKEFAATKAAVRYSNVIRRIAGGSSNFKFDQDTLLTLHKDLMYDDAEKDSVKVHFRQQECKIRTGSRGTALNIYVAPAPEEIPMLIDDLLAYCNTSRLSPTTQAAVAHFHLEAIRPFKTGMDRTGRAFCHMIMKRRRLYQHVIPPIALVPAMNIPDHAALLFPYRMNVPFTEDEAMKAIDRWTLHCAQCLVLSVKLVRQLMQDINELENSWRSKIKNIRNGSALDLLLCELPGWPVFTVSTAMAITGKGFSAANDAVETLVELGILKPTNNYQRNRCFASREALDLVESISNQIIPTELTSRESVFS